MVLSVCRQMLRDSNDVDDAFQATFVVFMEKAAGLKQPDRLGPWLYGVAYRVASRLRRRRRAEGLPRDLRSGGRLGSDPGESEQMAALHDEIERLPEKYRLPIVLVLRGRRHARRGGPQARLAGGNRARAIVTWPRPACVGG